MTTFIPYQIDYSVQNAAKTLGFSKKKVLFRFGFANKQVIRDSNAGATGAACRGSEHELQFVWSLNTGKRTLYLDGRELHYSESGQNGWTTDRSWQHSFLLRDATLGLDEGIRVHFVSQPVNKDIPGSRPFDVRIGGASYFSFNQIYQLGTPSMTVREVSRGYGRASRPVHEDDMFPEERRQIAQAKLESLKELSRQQGPPPSTTSSSMNRDEPSLIDLGQPMPPQQIAQPGGAYNQFASSVTLDPAFSENNRVSDASAPYPIPPITNGNPMQPNPYAPVQAPTGNPPPFQQQQAAMPQHGMAPPMYGVPASNSTVLATYNSGYPTSAYAQPTQHYGQTSAPSYAMRATQTQHQYTTPHAMMSPGANSMGGQSFGSAPSFAQPPKNQQHHFQG